MLFSCGNSAGFHTFSKAVFVSLPLSLYITDEDRDKLFKLMDDKKEVYKRNMEAKDEEIKDLRLIISNFKKDVKSKIELISPKNNIDYDHNIDPIFSEFEKSYSEGEFSFSFRNIGEEAIITRVDNQNNLGNSYSPGVLLKNEKLTFTLNTSPENLPNEIYFKVHYKNLNGEEKSKSFTYLVGEK